MTVGSAIKVLKGIIELKSPLTVFLQGRPGAGKNAAVAEACRQAKLRQMTLALPTCEAVDLRGLPYVSDTRATLWASPLPRDGRGLLLLDELASAPREVQVAAHHVVWHERGSDMSVGQDWHVVITSNRAEDKAVYSALSAPLRNRLVILTIEPDFAEWREWALSSRINPAVIGFLQFRPKLLSVEIPPADGAFPSPRSWEIASEWLKLPISAAEEREGLVGIVGEGATVEFSAYLQLARRLPQVEAILADQEHAPIPDEPDLTYALVAALSQYTREHKTVAMQYCNRLTPPFALLYLRDIADVPEIDLRSDEHVRAWIKKHPKLWKRD